MPTFNTVAERDAYYANKLKTAGVAPAINPQPSSVTYNQPAKTTGDGSWINSSKPAGDGSWINSSKPATVTQPTNTQTTTQTTQTQAQNPVVPTDTRTDAQKAADLAKQDEIDIRAQEEKGRKEQNVFAKKEGLATTPETVEEIIADQKSRDVKAKTDLQRQLDYQRSVDQAQQARFNEQAKGAIGATTAAYAQGREGAMAGGASSIRNEFTAETNKQIEENRLRLTEAQAQRDSLMTQLDQAQRDGETKLAESLSKSLSQAKQQIELNKTNYMNALTTANEQARLAEQSTISNLKNLSDSGILSTATADDIQALSKDTGISVKTLTLAASVSATKGLGESAKAQLDNLNSFTDMAAKGVPFDLTTIGTIAQSTGLDMGTLANIAQLGQQVSKTKGVEQEKAQADLVSAVAEANQKQRGIFTTAQQNYDYLEKMYNSGASPDAIAAFKSAASITDVNDPKYKAELSYKLAQATIEQAHAEGRAITPDDLAKFAEASESWAFANGAGAEPTPGGEDLASVALSYKTDGDWRSDFKNNKVYQGGNLGCAVVASGILKAAGVLDKKYPSIATLVPALKAEGWTRVEVPQKGDVVVWGPMQGTDGHGHIGIATSGTKAVNNQGPSGPAETLIFNGRTTKPSKEYPNAGFYRPPVSVQMGAGTKSTFYTDAMNEARDVYGITDVKKAKAYADDKVAADIKAKTTEKNTGKVSSEDRIATNQLRTQFDAQPAVKDYKVVRDLKQDFENVVNGQFQGAGDLQMVYGFMKALDPTSVVRETEFNAAANTGNIFQGSLAKFNGAFVNGQKLPQEVRDQFMSVINSRLATKEKGFEKEYNRYKKMTEEQGLNPEWVVEDYTGKLDKSQPKQPSAVESISNWINNNFNAKPTGTPFDYVDTTSADDIASDWANLNK